MILLFYKNSINANPIVGVGVLDDPSGKFDLDGQIFPHAQPLPFCSGGDVEDTVPCVFPLKLDIFPPCCIIKSSNFEHKERLLCIIA